ncbi:MAG: DUF6268 family outer membrane beta-barrel protein [Lentimicrobiaceae bacterium]|nr:DUF6268 family outer membrane beta-barrel protein [Lentimicrobiaceae bacterium]
MKKTYLLLLVLGTFLSGLRAQPFVDVLNVQGTYFPKTNYDNYPGAKNETWQGAVNAFIPVVLKNKNTVLTGISYENMCFDMQYDTSSQTESTQLSSVTAQLGFIYQFANTPWSVTVLAVPRIASDLKNFSGKHYQMGGALLFTYQVRKSLKLKIGGYYNREFFGNYFMGLAGIDWKAGKRIYVYGVLPGSLNLEYRISPWLYTGLAYKCITASYRLGNPDNSYYVREGDTFWGDSRLSNFYHLYLTKNLVFNFDAGYSLYRYFEQYNSRDKVEVTRPVFHKSKDNWFFNTGLSFRIRLDNAYND